MRRTIHQWYNMLTVFFLASKMMRPNTPLSCWIFLGILVSMDQFQKILMVMLTIKGSSGIPEWISHKSMGCEVRIELPENWYKDDNFLGFALFSYHLPLDDNDDEECKTMYPHCSYELSIYHGDQFKLSQSLPIGGISYQIGRIKMYESYQRPLGYDKGGILDLASDMPFLPLDDDDDKEHKKIYYQCSSQFYTSSHGDQFGMSYGLTFPMSCRTYSIGGIAEPNGTL